MSRSSRLVGAISPLSSECAGDGGGHEAGDEVAVGSGETAILSTNNYSDAFTSRKRLSKISVRRELSTLLTLSNSFLNILEK